MEFLCNIQNYLVRQIYAENFFHCSVFLAFSFLIDLAFRHTINPITNLLAVVCWIIAFIISVGLDEYTLKKIEEKYSKK